MNQLERVDQHPPEATSTKTCFRHMAPSRADSEKPGWPFLCHEQRLRKKRRIEPLPPLQSSTVPVSSTGEAIRPTTERQWQRNLPYGQKEVARRAGGHNQICPKESMPHEKGQGRLPKCTYSDPSSAIHHQPDSVPLLRLAMGNLVSCPL